MAILLFLLYLIFSLVVIYLEAQTIVWEIGSVVYLFIAIFIIGLPWLIALLLCLVIIAIIALIHAPFLQEAITNRLFVRASHALPKLTKTEEEALNSGETWLEEDIFRGTPDWERLHSISTDLTQEEQAFLEGETQTLCAMLNDWTIGQEQDLPKAVWDFMKEKGFFGLVIAKEYGGKGFSARAHSEVVMRIASCSGVAAVTCMVPNSLGPGELLHFYGTQAQKKHYLPKLAKGIDIPCFALTEPGAGSDATSIQTEAYVVRRMKDGKEVLGLNIVHLNKRWITLAPVATLIGLAVVVKDPDGLLNGKGQEGITCLLIPRTTENLEIGNRHLPAFQPFMNGPIRGDNIFVPIDCIIGGQKNAGHGWQMLVECLSIGRSISLPATASAGAFMAYLGTSAFGRVRKQFHVEIAEFEGVEEKLAEIAGLTYLVAATRLLTLAAVQEHKKPSVASAITKYFNTELARIVTNHAMDVHAGQGIIVGPRNYLATNYIGLPISITVEGANIMSRNLLIFGQGSMACHPFIRDEFYAVSQQDKKAFAELLWKHIHYCLKNVAKAVCSAWTGGLFIQTPKSQLKREYKRLAHLSHAFAMLADISLIYLGGALKRKERLSARLADGLSYLYMAMATLALCRQQEETPEAIIHARWALSYCYYQAQKAMLDLCRNFPSRFLGLLLRFLAFPFGQTMHTPKDKLSKQLAKIMTTNNLCREEIKKSVFLTPSLSRMEDALQLILENEALYTKIHDLHRYSFGALKKQLAIKVSKGELTQAEMESIVKVEHARWDAIQVDEFSSESMKKKTFTSLADTFPNPLD